MGYDCGKVVLADRFWDEMGCDGREIKTTIVSIFCTLNVGYEDDRDSSATVGDDIM